MNRSEMNTMMQKLTDEKRLPLIELHMLTSTGPSLLNRDGNGRIKTIRVGGVTRARISSQAKKRPIRVKEYTANTVHSRYLTQKIAAKLKEMGKDDDYIKAALKFLGDKDGKGTGQILAFCDHDVTEIANILIDNAHDLKGIEKNKKILEKALEDNSKNRIVDDTTCLMGRMSTNNKLVESVEAACHLSHLYSIDAWNGDSDTYTAVDDLTSQIKEADFIQFLNDDVKDTGSAYLDASDIAANVFYGYTSISTRTLLENKLRSIDVEDIEGINNAIEESRDIIKTYITDYITIAPTSKQTSNATMPLPIAVLITVGNEVHPLTADSVFEKVVKGNEDKSVGDIGVERLKEFVCNITEGAFSVNDYEKLFWISDKYNNDIPEICIKTKLETALNEILSTVGE